MSNEQFDGQSAEIYAGAGNAPEHSHVDAAEDGGEIDGTVEPTSDDSTDDWGFEGKKRKLTREVLVGFAAIGVLVAVFGIVVAKSFFGDDADEKLAEGPPAGTPGPASEIPPPPDGDADEFLPPASPGPGGPALTHDGPIEPGEGNFGGEPTPTSIPDIPWPDTSPDRTVVSVDPDEDLFGPSTPTPDLGNPPGEWIPGEIPSPDTGTERPSGLLDSGTGDLPSPLDTPSGLPAPIEPTYEIASAPPGLDHDLPGSTSGDPFAAETPTDPLTGLPMPDPGGPNPALTTNDPAYGSGLLPGPDVSVLPDPSTSVGSDNIVGTTGNEIPGPSFAGESGPALGDVTPGYRDEPVAPIGALPDPGYPPATEPAALPVIEPSGPSPAIAASGDGFESPIVPESNELPGIIDQPGLVGTYNNSPLTGERSNIGSTGLPSGIAAEQYTVQQGDSFWTISKKAYGSGRYWQKLADFNRGQIPNPDRMRVGAVISIPDPTVFGANTSASSSADTAALVASIENANRVGTTASSAGTDRSDSGGIFFNAQGYPMYRIGGQDTLTTIAAKHLGRTSRWKQIYHMNREELQTPDKLQIGMVLQLPADASRVPLIARNSTFR